MEIFNRFSDPDYEGFITPKSLREQIGRMGGSGRTGALDREDLSDIFLDHLSIKSRIQSSANPDMRTSMLDIAEMEKNDNLKINFDLFLEIVYGGGKIKDTIGATAGGGGGGGGGHHGQRQRR